MPLVDSDGRTLLTCLWWILRTEHLTHNTELITNNYKINKFGNELKTLTLLYPKGNTAELLLEDGILLWALWANYQDKPFGFKKVYAISAT